MKILTRYGGHPGSNVGRATARLSGKGTERSVRMDQRLSSEQNHARAARKLAEALNLVLKGKPKARERGGYEFEAVELAFTRGDAVTYQTHHPVPVPADGMQGHVFGRGFYWKDDDGDGPYSEPYLVYPIQVQGGRGLGGFWHAESMVPTENPEPPTWPID